MIGLHRDGFDDDVDYSIEKKKRKTKKETRRMKVADEILEAASKSRKTTTTFRNISKLNHDDSALFKERKTSITKAGDDAPPPLE